MPEWIQLPYYSIQEVEFYFLFFLFFLEQKKLRFSALRRGKVKYNHASMGPPQPRGQGREREISQSR
jgi:hypothetical protein